MSNLIRYRLTPLTGFLGSPLINEVQCHDGEWVKFEDIKHLLPTGAQQPQGEICPRCDDGFIEGVAGMCRIRCPECKGLGKLSPHAADVG